MCLTAHSHSVDVTALERGYIKKKKNTFLIIEERKKWEKRHISQGITVSKLSFKGHKEIHPQSLQFGDNA